MFLNNAERWTKLGLVSLPKHDVLPSTICVAAQVHEVVDFCLQLDQIVLESMKNPVQTSPLNSTSKMASHPPNPPGDLPSLPWVLPSALVGPP